MSDLEEEEIDLLEEEFTRATKFIECSHDQFDQKDLLKFYGFYKQATVGKCNVPKPGIFNVSGRTKWSVWNDLGDLSKESAMKGYILHLVGLKPEWDQVSERDDFKPQKGSWVSVSTHANRDEEDDLSGDKSIVDFIKEGNLAEVQSALQSVDEDIGSIINALDEEGLGPIHWAADRGNIDILRLLLQVPRTNVDFRDSGGQTALHFAASCGNRECVQLLLEFGADRTVRDDEGESCVDVAFDEEIKRLLM
ncbi:acyl-CoA-binding domain-containing protein 6-like [Topomyia yanbarensis]|uniref:acyl-CoA-binding domain-containing protein 6-like n=1 Tax=Topomyia yanbarensis TaxID=2498891 RepID=UPI00273ABF7B|nr:acyl-CoA-binding domain-containing protein 6-like [Topomyia yanbarensis]